MHYHLQRYKGYFCAVFSKHNVLLSSITEYGYEYTSKQLQLSKDQIYDKIKVLIKAFTSLSNLFGNTLCNIKIWKSSCIFRHSQMNTHTQCYRGTLQNTPDLIAERSLYHWIKPLVYSQPHWDQHHTKTHTQIFNWLSSLKVDSI